MGNITPDFPRVYMRACSATPDAAASQPEPAPTLAAEDIRAFALASRAARGLPVAGPIDIDAALAAFGLEVRMVEAPGWRRDEAFLLPPWPEGGARLCVPSHANADELRLCIAWGLGAVLLGEGAAQRCAELAGCELLGIGGEA